MKGDGNELMDTIGDKIAKRLLDMNGELSEKIYMGIATATTDNLALINQTVAVTTIATLDVIDEFAQILPAGHDLGSTPWFAEGELQQKFDDLYTASINS